ncbi:MAG: arylamine N-acetyltransferase [Proteobacteria bacterium]|nr:arylamine N-acetyltransferase [Pseudomonadota bacterium]
MTARDAIDLSAYLARLGWSGATAPTRDVLDGLIAAHTAAIAFEAIDPWRGVPVTIDLPDLEAKLVRGGRGGYCFEHNLLFAAALRAIGFRVSYLAARVLWLQREDAITPRSHMLLRVELDEGPRLADVGFGRLTPTASIALVADVVQPTPLEPFRLVATGSDWRMQAALKGAWRTLYRFDLEPQHLMDLVLANHYAGTHPRSVFVNDLIAARPMADRRLTLQNRRFAIEYRDGVREARELRDVAEVRRVLAEQFGVAVPEDPWLDERLAGLPG